MTVHTEFPLRGVSFTFFEGYELSMALIFDKSNLIKYHFPEICLHVYMFQTQSCFLSSRIAELRAAHYFWNELHCSDYTKLSASSSANRLDALLLETAV